MSNRRNVKKRMGIWLGLGVAMMSQGLGLPVIQAAPTITTTDTTVYVGQWFNPLDHVSATDAVDGTLWPSVMTNTVTKTL